LDNLELNREAPAGRETLFADILLPIPIPKLFTYRVPYDLNEHIQTGVRVVVQFGAKKVLTGIVKTVHNSPPRKYEAKAILDIMDDTPVINTELFRLFTWMADYYMCTEGEVLQAGLPSGLKLSSQSKIQLNPRFLPDTHILSAEEENLVRALSNKNTLTYQEAANITNVNLNALIRTLLQKQAIILIEELQEKYKPKTRKRVRLSKKYIDHTKDLENLLNTLEKSPKQSDILLRYLKEVRVFQDKDANQQGLPKSDLKGPHLSASSLQTLIKKQVLEEFEEVIPRYAVETQANARKFTLTEKQQEVLENIMMQFEQRDAVLLHGITGSGKTEIYIRLIQYALENGNQALYLLPEIALTTQIVERLRHIFGDKMGVYHSRFSDNERVEVWQGLQSGKLSFIVGVRSSVFLPFDNLGLIIVDEEHETSYKQFDPAPRYQARDVALVLGKIHHAKTLLGSATPSMESFQNAENKKYGYVYIGERYRQARLPEFELINLKQVKKEKKLRGEFSNHLLSETEKTLSSEKQIIIFQNRRGYAPYLMCDICGHIPKCQHCDVSLTYHQGVGQLRCHYCGYREKVPVTCEACGTNKIKTVGLGTEKLEDELKIFFTKAKIRRMDLDTTRGKYSYQKLINDFEQKNIDILVGTQMVSKGLDFGEVVLVGIVDADRMIHFPDFRAQERAFQMITQVSGRAGRRRDPGKVIIQTYDPQQQILKRVIDQDYQGLYRSELRERKKFFYPPFSRLIRLTLKDRNKDKCRACAEVLTGSLRHHLKEKRVSGPIEPLINRIRNQYLMEIWIKLEKKGLDLGKVKQMMLEQIQQSTSQKTFRSVKIIADVDPY